MKWIKAVPAWLALLLLLIYSTFSASNFVLISTTTSLYDTGLLDVLAEGYEKATGVDVSFIPTGSGLALEYGKRGDVDVVLVHAPALEKRVLSENALGLRKIFAYNFFVIIGPASDPAKIRGLLPAQALQQIAETKSPWVSRGDNSGTNLKEKDLWRLAGYVYEEIRNEPWFLESGSGMGTTLIIANEKGAYTLSDAGTYLRYSRENLIQLQGLVRESEELLNVYSVMVVNPSVHPSVKFEEAVEFVKFLISQEGQSLIANFGLEDFGIPLFYPAVEVLERRPSEVGNWIKTQAFFDNAECPPHLRFGQEGLY
jgi:tungstate transport system substrate-binding protein